MGAGAPRTPRVKVMVVNFNGGDHVIECLRRLEAVDWPRSHLDTLIVDNASTDGSAERIAGEFPGVRLVKMSANVGYAAGNNVGFREHDEADYYALLNNDAFVERNWLRPLVAALEADQRAGAAASKILLATQRATVDGRAVDVVNNAGNVLYTDGYGADRGLGEPDAGQYDEPGEVFAWCGCSALLRRSYVSSVGGFDEDLFAYYEDFDLSWRGRKEGWRYVYVPSSVVRHLHAATSVEGTAFFDRHVERNRLVVMARNGPPRFVVHVLVRTLRTLAAVFVADVVRPVTRMRAPQFRRFWRRLSSLVSFTRRAPRIIRERRQLRRRQTVSDDEVLAWLVSR